MKTNGTLCQLPDLRGGATHQFRQAGAHLMQTFLISLTDLIEE